MGVDAPLHRAGTCAAPRREGRDRRRASRRCCTVPTSRRRSRSRTPIVVAANGPKGLEVAHELGDGVMTIGAGDPSFAWCSVLAFGTVLDERREPPTSTRALDAAGPAMTVVYHAMYEGDPASVDALPGGVEWRKAVGRVPGDRAASRGPQGPSRASDRARPAAARRRPDGGVHLDWRRRRRACRASTRSQAQGGTEILYAPMGSDVPRELRTFMQMATMRP